VISRGGRGGHDSSAVVRVSIGSRRSRANRSVLRVRAAIMSFLVWDCRFRNSAMLRKYWSWMLDGVGGGCTLSCAISWSLGSTGRFGGGEISGWGVAGSFSVGLADCSTGPFSVDCWGCSVDGD
jgi:hypothetical protein